jgi:hypothetical protein
MGFNPFSGGGALIDDIPFEPGKGLTHKLLNHFLIGLRHKSIAMSVQTIAMGDAAVQLVLNSSPGSGEVELIGNLLQVDPESTGAGENLTLPLASNMAGVSLTIKNTGGENVVVKDGATTISTILPGYTVTVTSNGAVGSDWALNADNGTSGVQQVTRVVYVDGARTDTYTESGSISTPFKTVQAAVDYAEANMAPVQLSPVVILIYPNGGPCYLEDVIVKKTGIDLRGMGGVDTGSGTGSVYIRTLILSNATAASIATFIAAGGIANPAANYGLLVAGAFTPEVNNFVDLGFGDPSGAGADNTRLLLGVGNGCLLASLGCTFNRCTDWGPAYFRNAGFIGVNDCAFFGGAATFNITSLMLSGSYMGDYTADYDSAQDQPVDISNNGLVGGFGSQFTGTFPITLNGEARMGFGGIFFSEAAINGTLALNDASRAKVFGGNVGDVNVSDTAILDIRGTLIRGAITVGGDATINLEGTHVQGNLTFANAGGLAPCTFDGGRYMGTLTDAGARLTRNVGN